MTDEERINSLQWFQRFEINGIWTPGTCGIDVYKILGMLPLPDDLGGKSVLDAGANDGFFSFECERRGAESVFAVDHHFWGFSGMPRSSYASFDLARELLRSGVAPFSLDLENEDLDFGHLFDLALALGLIYHLKNPVSVLTKIRNALRPAGGKIILETHLACLDVEEPTARLYPNADFNNDCTTYWGPNVPCVLGWMRLAGFVNCRHHQTYHVDPNLPESARGVFSGETP